MEIIYIDSLFFLNLMADYLLCLSAGRLCSLRLKRRRYLLAALFGAAYSAAAVLPGAEFLSATPLKLLSGLVMGLAAFGGERRPLRCIGVFFAVSAAFAGALWGLSLSSPGPVRLSFKGLLLSFAVCYALFRLVFHFKSSPEGRQLVPVTADFLGARAEFTALVDTGNSLSDPLSGARVLIACPHALKPILGSHAPLFEQLQPVELAELCAGIPALAGKIRLIPYCALGASGMLPVFRPDSLSIDGKPDRESLIAISPDAAGDGFDAII